MSRSECLLAWVKARLSPERYAHTVRVVSEARRLAALHGVDVAQAEEAAAIHDCARDLPHDVLLKLTERFAIVLSEVERHTPALLHALLGAELAKREAGVQDEQVLEAVRCHTTGKAGMSQLDKVLFLADYIEPGRRFAGVCDVRDAVDRDLDAALILALSGTIVYEVSRGSLLHPATVEARNYLLLARKAGSAASIHTALTRRQ
jgi:predicted HD superfamily hydrolase involved in NAD metabolism